MLMHSIAIVFWTALSLIVVAHVAYPAAMVAASSIWGKKRKGNAEERRLPTITLVIPAYNEEKVLEAKLDNSLHINYPKDRLEILVCSDGSSDRTVDIARSREADGVRTLACSARRGKAATVNDAVKAARGAVICLCDANVMFDPHALRRLVGHLADPEVGAASGDVQLASYESDFGTGESFYYFIERALQLGESRLGSVMCVDGGMYIVRRELFQPLEPDTILDDFVTTIRVIQQGKRVVYDPTAVATENGTPTALQEFRRRVRITAGAVQAVKRGEFPSPLRKPLEFLQFVSHKLLRWLGPVWLGSLLLSNALLWTSGILYQITMISQLAVYALAAAATASVRLRQTRLGGIAFYVVMSYIAMAVGLFKGLLNLQRVTWQVADRRHVPAELAPDGAQVSRTVSAT